MVVVEVLLNARREDVLIMLMGTALGCRKALLVEAVVVEEEEEEEEEGALRAVPRVLLDEAPKLRDGMILRFAIRPANVELGSLRVLPLPPLLLLLLLLRDLNVLLGTYPPDEDLRLRLTTAGACFLNCWNEETGPACGGVAVEADVLAVLCGMCFGGV